MYKKILAVLAGAAFSAGANATVTYTQYNFEGSDISGYFVQRDDNRAIANYRIQVRGLYVGASFHPFPFESNIVAANNNHPHDGPTSFTIFDELNDLYHQSWKIDLESGTRGYHLAYAQQVLPWAAGKPSYDTHPLSLSLHGAVTRSSVDPAMAAELNSYGGYIDGINQIVPTHRVPEPATLGLLAIGALGVAGAARRSKPAR